MEFTIRQEKELDFPIIYDLIKISFETAKVKDGDEQDFARRLRQSKNYIPELALVAELEGEIIGHIMFTKTYITSLTTKELVEVLMLAPISVLLEYRNKGVGSALIKRGFDIARSLGYKAVFLCGDPQYYMRFGFKPINHFNLIHKSIPEPFVMGFELIPESLNGMEGEVRVG